MPRIIVGGCTAVELVPHVKATFAEELEAVRKAAPGSGSLDRVLSVTAHTTRGGVLGAQSVLAASNALVRAALPRVPPDASAHALPLELFFTKVVKCGVVTPFQYARLVGRPLPAPGSTAAGTPAIGGAGVPSARPVGLPAAASVQMSMRGGSVMDKFFVLHRLHEPGLREDATVSEFASCIVDANGGVGPATNAAMLLADTVLGRKLASCRLLRPWTVHALSSVIAARDSISLQKFLEGSDDDALASATHVLSSRGVGHGLLAVTPVELSATLQLLASGRGDMGGAAVPMAIEIATAVQRLLEGDDTIRAAFNSAVSGRVLLLQRMLQLNATLGSNSLRWRVLREVWSRKPFARLLELAEKAGSRNAASVAACHMDSTLALQLNKHSMHAGMLSIHPVTGIPMVCSGMPLVDFQRNMRLLKEASMDDVTDKLAILADIATMTGTGESSSAAEYSMTCTAYHALEAVAKIFECEVVLHAAGFAPVAAAAPGTKKRVDSILRVVDPTGACVLVVVLEVLSFLANQASDLARQPAGVATQLRRLFPRATIIPVVVGFGHRNDSTLECQAWRRLLRGPEGGIVVRAALRAAYDACLLYTSPSPRD